MENVIEKFHIKLRHLPHVSSAIVLRYFKIGGIKSHEIANEIIKFRDAEGIPRWIRGKKSGKRNSKFRQIVENKKPKKKYSDNQVHMTWRD